MPTINNYDDCLNMLMCPNPETNCHFRTCTKCPGIEQIREFFVRLFDENDIETITIKQWVSKPRTTLETQIQNASDFVDELCDKAACLQRHAFIAKQQSQYLKTLKSSLNEGQFIVICYLAENYAFVVQEAVPGFHWNNNQATIYPVVIYFRQNGDLMHRSLVIISDCLKHDAVAVYTFSRIINDFIKSISQHPLRIFYFSDGVPQQYNNFKNFAKLYYHEDDFGVPAEWHFFETAHGKGPCNDIGGTIKRLASRASSQLGVTRQIITPAELFEWAALPTNFSAAQVRFSTATDYSDSKNMLDGRFEKIFPHKKSQKQHAFIPGTDGTITSKLYSTDDKHIIIHNIC